MCEAGLDAVISLYSLRASKQFPSTSSYRQLIPLAIDRETLQSVHALAQICDKFIAAIASTILLAVDQVVSRYNSLSSLDVVQSHLSNFLSSCFMVISVLLPARC